MNPNPNGIEACMHHDCNTERWMVTPLRGRRHSVAVALFRHPGEVKWSTDLQPCRTSTLAKRVEGGLK